MAFVNLTGVVRGKKQEVTAEPVEEKILADDYSDFEIAFTYEPPVETFDEPQDTLAQDYA